MAAIDDVADARRTSRGRLALVTAGAVFVAVAITVVVSGPDEVVGHFGGDGQATRMDPTGPFVLTMSLVTLGLVALFAATPALVRRIPIAFVNVPNRERWNTPELRAVLARRVGADMNLIGAASVLLVTAAVIASALGGLGIGVPAWALWLTLMIYLALIAILLVRMYASGRYEPPTP